MKNKLVLILLVFFISCNNDNGIEKHNKFFELNTLDLSHLDSLNQILFRNKDKINAEDFEASLKGHDSIQYKKSYKAFQSIPINNGKDTFELFMADLYTSDSVVVYQIKMEAYGPIKIYHSLVFRENPDKKQGEADTRIVKTKRLNIHWTYNIINDK